MIKNIFLLFITWQNFFGEFSMPVECFERNSLGWIIVNRPERLNAYNIELMDEIIECAKKHEADKNVKIIALTSKGKLFSAGVDLKDVAEKGTPEGRASVFKKIVEMVTFLINMEKPFIIGVNGDAYGIGAEILWTADIVIAVKGAKIVWPESRWGYVPPGIISIGLYSLGIHRATYLAMTSGSITTDEAYKFGIVSELVEKPEDVEKAIEEAKNRIMANSPTAVRYIKDVVRIAKATHLLNIAGKYLVESAKTKEAEEAAKKFLEKKQPKYEW